MKQKAVSFLRNHWLILIIWLVSLFLRCYRQTDLLGFYYDQARDAKMAADILSFRNLPAIGPTTGIQGLYLGPFWFYLITPGYFFGQGNPAIASYFIAFLESLTIPLIYYLVKTYWQKSTALTASFFWAFSNYLIRSSRWFSNPSPIPFFVLLIMLCLLKTIQGDKRFLPLVFLLLGLSLQLEAASAVFFIPTIIIFGLLNYPKLKKLSIKTWLLSALAFLILLVPQLAFELKNQFFITKNFIGFLTGKVNSATGQSWAIPSLVFIKNRLFMYYQSFFSKLDTNVTILSLILLVLFLIGLIILIRRHRQNNFVQLQLLWLFAPLTLLLFFVGNYGTLYDYYLTGFFPSFIILFSLCLSSFSRKYLSIAATFLAIYIFISGNFIYIRDYLSAGVDGPEHISLGNQSASVRYICKEVEANPYNVNIYVPPITPHTYEYLFSWYSKKKLCALPQQNPTQILYTLHEVDPPHPERLNLWLENQNKSSRVINETKFGGVVVQKRQRI